MKVATTPFGSVLSGMSVKYCKETLTTHARVVNHKGMGILHISSCTFVFRHANLICIVLCGVTIQDLECHQVNKIAMVSDTRCSVLHECQYPQRS